MNKQPGRIPAWEAASLEELKNRLESREPRQKRQGGFVELKLHGKDILIRQFELMNVKVSELNNTLKLDALEIFSLPSLNEVELDYRIFEAAGDKIRGIFIAMPRRRMRGYSRVLARVGLIPVKVTARSVAALADFLKTERKAVKSNFCAISFFDSNNLSLAVFINNNCELIREISYENFAAAEQSVLDSLKYSYGRSETKQLNKLYFLGDIEGKQDLIKRLKEQIEVTDETPDLQTHLRRIPYHDLLGKLNLAKSHALLLPLKNTIKRALALVLLAGTVTAVVRAMESQKTANEIKELRGSINHEELQRARELLSKIELLSHDL